MATQDRTKYNAYLDKLKDELIIPIEQITATSMLDLNINLDKLIYAVVNSQKLYLEPLIGSAMVRKLQETNLTFEYDLLLDRFLNDALINWGISECIQGLAYSVAQGGIYRHDASDSELPDAKEIATIRQNYLSKGDEFGRRLIDFLNKNKSYYPEYSQNSGDGLNSSKRQLFTGGLQIESKKSIQIFDGFDSTCSSGGVGRSDPSVFSAATYYGNSDETDMGFDQTTLAGSDNTVPDSVIAQPINNYFWVVSTIKVYPAQVGTRIPTVPFTDVDANTEIFVSGEQDGLFWLRIKIAETYENAVQFELQI